MFKKIIFEAVVPTEEWLLRLRIAQSGAKINVKLLYTEKKHGSSLICSVDTLRWQWGIQTVQSPTLSSLPYIYNTHVSVLIKPSNATA
jgi:hypothetical protein